MAEEWTMSPGGIATCDPRAVSRFLCRHYLVIESKANKDELVEFCHLVVLLDLKNKEIPQRLNTLVDNVMNDPQRGQVQKAVSELKSYAKRLEHDPREGSTEVAKAWRKTKELREGRVAYELDHNPTSQGSSSNGEFKTSIPILVKVWSQTQDRLNIPYSEIRCAVPDLAMIGNVHNIIRYAATGFNFPYVRGQRQLKAKKLDITTQAMLYTGSPAPEWNMIEKSRKLAAVKDTDSLQLVNTKLKTAAVAVVVRARRALSEPFIFDIENPLKLVETFNAIMGRREIVDSIAQAQSTFIRTRFLSITSEGTDPPFVMPQPPSNRSLGANPTAVPSGIPSPPSTISPSSPAAQPRLPNSPPVDSGPQPAPALPHPIGVIDAQSTEAIENSPNDTRSPSPTESHYSDAWEEIKPPATSQVHRHPGGRLPGRPPQAPPPNTTPPAPTPSASSAVVAKSSVTPTPTISSPENPPVTDSTEPEQKQPVSFVRRVIKRLWG